MRLRRTSFPLPLWERVASIVRCEPGEGARSTAVATPLTRPSLRSGTLSHLAQLVLRLGRGDDAARPCKCKRE